MTNSTVMSVEHGIMLMTLGKLPGYMPFVIGVILVLIGALSTHVAIVHRYRFKNVNDLKKRLGFTDDPDTYMNMTVEQAQEVERNMAEHDFPFLFEFGWIFNFFKTASAPCLSRVIVKSGHFTSRRQRVSHKRQQDTVCLMTAMMAQPFHSEFHGLAIARINEHHRFWGNHINSDTILWLSEMWMQGPVQWINLAGWRKLEPFEIQAMFIFWRELSVMLGCKWVPNTLEELKMFREAFVKLEQRPSTYNVTFSESIMSAVLFSVPFPFEYLARQSVIALLDEDVRFCNKYDKEFKPPLRKLCLGLLKACGWFQRHFCLPRVDGRVLTPTEANENGLVNFPEYTFPASPYYVRPTWWNTAGPRGYLDWFRAIPRPHLYNFHGEGVKWESMGAKHDDRSTQANTESRVLEAAKEIMHQPFGYRTHVKLQPRSICVDQSYGQGYGSAENAYTDEELSRKCPSLVEEHEDDVETVPDAMDRH